MDKSSPLKPSTEANDRQVGGDHYASPIQHWDFAASNNFDYFQGQITKYVTRWKLKNGVEDLKKARHFLDKYIELSSPAPESDPMPERERLYQPSTHELVNRVYSFKDFIFEGARNGRELYTCKHCGEVVGADCSVSPYFIHGDCAKPVGYVNQG